jgi:3-phenylpropionate/trans-cinnamate dioxygenase ferredoxin subunit
MRKHVVAPLEDLPPGTRKLVSIDGRAIVVLNVAGELFALIDRCPHRGGSLCEGKLTGLVEASEPGRYLFSRPNEILRCPWHGWEFDIRTGKSRCDPEKVRAKSYEVAVEL